VKKGFKTPPADELRKLFTNVIPKGASRKRIYHVKPGNPNNVLLFMEAHHPPVRENASMNPGCVES
jgi:hypothetical protein